MAKNEWVAHSVEITEIYSQAVLVKAFCVYTAVLTILHLASRLKISWKQRIY